MKHAMTASMIMALGACHESVPIRALTLEEQEMVDDLMEQGGYADVIAEDVLEKTTLPVFGMHGEQGEGAAGEALRAARERLEEHYGDGTIYVFDGQTADLQEESQGNGAIGYNEEVQRGEDIIALFAGAKEDWTYGLLMHEAMHSVSDEGHSQSIEAKYDLGTTTQEWINTVLQEGDIAYLITAFYEVPDFVIRDSLKEEREWGMAVQARVESGEISTLNDALEAFDAMPFYSSDETWAAHESFVFSSAYGEYLSTMGIAPDALEGILRDSHTYRDYIAERRQESRQEFTEWFVAREQNEAARERQRTAESPPYSRGYLR